MFQSVWSGPLEHCGQKTHTDLLRSIYNGEKAESVIASFSKILLFVIYGFTACFLILRGRKHDGWEIFVMFFIGGLLFHTVWEGKSQYVYPYVFGMIPFAAAAVKWTTDRLKILTDKLIAPKAALAATVSASNEADETKDRGDETDTAETITKGEADGEE